MSAPNIERARQIPGWMHPDELRWLAERAQTADLIIEIGSWKGRSTRALGDNCDGHIYVIDNWKDPLEDTDQTNQELKERGSDAIHAEWRENLADLIATRTVRLIRQPSPGALTELKRRLPTRRADLVFIDADHTYEGCLRDIHAYAQLVKPGGILAGHDYGVKAHPGVKRAVDEVFGARAEKGPRTIWFVRMEAE